jgi:biopolymer transport protein ExbD
MRGRLRRREKPIVDLDVTAFINLMVVLVAFFLSMVAFYQFSSLELNIPPSSAGAAQDGEPEALELEIILRKDGLEVSNRGAGLIRRFDKSADAYDYKAVGELLKQIKTRFPEKTNATILAEADIPYEILVQTMDTTRSYAVIGPNTVHYVDLFPDLSIGDAPVDGGLP